MFLRHEGFWCVVVPCLSLALFHDSHLFNQVPSTSKLVDDEEYITDIDADVAANVGIVDEVAHRAFPAAVEVKAEKLPLSVQNWAA